MQVPAFNLFVREVFSRSNLLQSRSPVRLAEADAAESMII
jgi:hypothetical protein